uniref:Uncharacterized LOC105915307 n=1 Tax=Fundulus heteroclitus TaxID=8078 RepID=A0A3Q2QPZ9_FUNHE
MALILAVFNYPELYNVTLPNYRCTESRINAWRNISMALGHPSQECKRKWKNLRDRYLKEVRMELKSKKQGEFVQSKWKYRQLMNFIGPFTGSRVGVMDPCGNEDDNEHESGTKSSPGLRNAWQVKDGGGPFSTRPRQDEDELFLLSFVPALKRLAPQKRCETKMKIQQIMYEAEFNVQDKKAPQET